MRPRPVLDLADEAWLDPDRVRFASAGSAAKGDSFGEDAVELLAQPARSLLEKPVPTRPT